MSVINSTFLPVAMATSLLPLVTLEDLGRLRATQTPSCVAGCGVESSSLLPAARPRPLRSLSLKGRTCGKDTGGVFAAASAESF